MASGTKKRRKSQSPARGKASKRARISTAKSLSHSQYTGHEAQASRAESVKDAYLTQKQDRSTSLPTGEDWVFRVKVISSATDLGNDLFKNAVQGLVRICFPEGILDQLGPQVLEQHMREERAPEQNVQRMTEIFRSGMAQRIASMLAEHLDTAPRVDTVVTTLLAASARAHGDKLGKDILGHVTMSLLRLQARGPKKSTEWLVNSVDVQEAAGKKGDTSNEDSSDDEPKLPRKRNRSKRQCKKRSTVPDIDTDLGHLSEAELEPPKRPKKQDNDRKRTQDVDTDLEDNAVDIIPPAPPAKQKTSKNKDRKISPKWQWDVESEELADDDVARIFSRTSDLFAYHALPISRRKLGVGASRKEIRCEMQSLLNDMPESEFEKWEESLQKLLKGDREMLVRQDITALSINRQLSRATPAPVDLRRKAGAKLNPSSRDSEQSKERVNGVRDTYGRTIIKREPTGGSDGVVGNSTNRSMSETTVAFCHLSTEEREFDRSLPSVEASDLPKHPDLQSSDNVDSAFGMPVLSLLWGSDSLNTTECMSESVKITQTIMSNLKHRISADRIVMSGLGGMNKTRTMSELHNTIIQAFPKPGRHYSFMRIKKDIEAALIPWVIAEPSAFPELKTIPFVFAHSVPSVAVVLNLLFGSWSVASALSGSEMWDSILRALQRRGISEASVGAANIDCLQIDSLCDKSRHPETTRRALLERVMRRLAFSHREKFPELKSTPVVMTWERKTGLTWGIVGNVAYPVLHPVGDRSLHKSFHELLSHPC